MYSKKMYRHVGVGKKQTTTCTQMLPKFYFSIYYTVKLCNLAGYVKSLGCIICKRKERMEIVIEDQSLSQ